MTDDELWQEFIETHRAPLKLTDFTGTVRVFKLSGFKTNGYTINAREAEGSDRRFEFSAGAAA